MRVFFFFVLILLLPAGCDMNTPEDVREAVQRLADREAPAPLPEFGQAIWPRTACGSMSFSIFDKVEQFGLPCLPKKSHECDVHALRSAFAAVHGQSFGRTS